MILIENLNQIAAQLKTERAITPLDLIDAIEQALVVAYCRHYSHEEEKKDQIKAVLNPTTGEGKLLRTKVIVSTLSDPDTEITLDEVKSKNLLGAVGETVEVDVTPASFGRVAVQAAKNIIMQLINESEKVYVYDKFKSKIGQLVNGVVQRIEGSNYLINLGDIEATLTRRDQIPGETLAPNDHIRVLLSDITMSQRGPQLHISRSSPDMLRELFKLEVPEIQQKNIIEIKSIAREAGLRSKIAVYSHHPDVGAVGTCVGHMGSRIQAILKAISNEKIDILEWDELPRQYIANSMKPATVTKVVITNSEEKQALVIVPSDQLSLAIGKKGVNVRLAVRLTGWKLDIMSEEDYGLKKDSIVEAPTESLSQRIQQDMQQVKPVRLADNIRKQLIINHKEDEDDQDDGVSGQLSQLAHMYGFDTDDFCDELIAKGVQFERSKPLTQAQLTAIRTAFGNQSLSIDNNSDTDE